MDVGLFARLACGRVVVVTPTKVVLDSMNGCSLLVEMRTCGRTRVAFRVEGVEVTVRAIDAGTPDAMELAADVARCARGMVLGWVRLHVHSLDGMPCGVQHITALACAQVVARFCGLRVTAYHDRHRKATLTGGTTVMFAREAFSVAVASTRPFTVGTHGGVFEPSDEGVRLTGSNDVYGVLCSLAHATWARIGDASE